MKIFLTGATGLLGFNLAKCLTESGYEVTTISRMGNPMLEALVKKAIKGDLKNQKLLEKSMKGSSIVIHAAADTNHLSFQNNKNNVLLTKNMLEAAKKNGIEKFIYVSSANTIGHGTKKNPGNEASPLNENDVLPNYIHSKIAAEKLVWKEICELGFPAVIVNPTFMLGAYDFKLSSGKLLTGLFKQKFLFYPKGGKNVVHVKDVCIAIKNAIDLGEIGEHYILGNQNLFYIELFEMIAAILQKKQRLIPLPDSLLMAYAHWETAKYKLFKQQPLIDLPSAKVAMETYFYDVSKARAVLKLPKTPVKEAIKDSYQWLLENNKMKSF